MYVYKALRAPLDLGLPELRRLRGHDDVAGHRELAAAAQREAAHRGDDGLAPAPLMNETKAPNGDLIIYSLIVYDFIVYIIFYIF